MTGEAGEKFRAAAPAGPRQVPGPPAPSPGSLPRWALGSPPEGSTARGDPAPRPGLGLPPPLGPSPPAGGPLTPPPGSPPLSAKGCGGQMETGRAATARRAGTEQTTRPRAVPYRGEGVGGDGDGTRWRLRGRRAPRTSLLRGTWSPPPRRLRRFERVS